MSLRTIFFLISLLLIEFSVDVKGYDEIRTAQLKKELTDMMEKSNEAMVYLRYVNKHWQEINPNDQNEIWRLYQRVTEYSRNANVHAGRPEPILQICRNIFNTHLNELREYLKGVVYYHLRASRVQINDQRLILEFQLLLRQLEQMTKNYAQILQLWREVPDAAKNIIKNSHLGLQNIAKGINPLIPRQPITIEQVALNRKQFFKPITELNDYLNKVLQYIENTRRQQVVPSNTVELPRPAVFQDVQNQQLRAVGQKRSFEPDYNRLGQNKKRRP